MIEKRLMSEIDRLYSNPKCELDYGSPFELLVAVILSAQCTDKRVNIVTRELFAVANTPERMLNLSIEELEDIIHPCGFFRNKAKNILLASKDIVEKYDGKVPSKMNELVGLAGVGVKTASVVQSMAFGIPALAVDTHVFRVSNRLGIVNCDTVDKTHKALLMVVPKSKWITFHYALVLHGRYICKAKNPLCDECSFAKYCKYYVKNMKK